MREFSWRAGVAPRLAGANEFMRARTTVVLSALVGLLASCGGGGGGTATAPTSSETIYGIPVPPATSADTSTVIGLDSNRNGLRDEVERALALDYGQKPAAYEAAVRLAKLYQTWLVSPPSTQTAARAAVLDEMRLSYCLSETPGVDREDARYMAQSIHLKTFSTPSRMQLRRDLYKLSGPIQFPATWGCA